MPKLLPGDTQRYLRAGVALREELADRLGPQGVMIFPSYASPAPRHIKPLLPPWYFVYTAIINVLERVRGIMLTFGLPLKYRAWGAGGQDACCGRLGGCVRVPWGSVEPRRVQHGLRRKCVEASGGRRRGRPRGLRANGGLGPARLVERRGRLWRRSEALLWEPPPQR